MNPEYALNFQNFTPLALNFQNFTSFLQQEIVKSICLHFFTISFIFCFAFTRIFFSSKGNPVTDQDEPVAFFVTDEDWYVCRHDVNCVLCYRKRCRALFSTQKRFQGDGKSCVYWLSKHCSLPPLLLMFRGSMSSGWLLLNFQLIDCSPNSL